MNEKTLLDPCCGLTCLIFCDFYAKSGDNYSLYSNSGIMKKEIANKKA